MDFAREVGTGMGSDWTGYLFKRTNPELRDVKEKIMRFFPRMFPGVKFNRSPYFEVLFPTGEKLMLRHMGNEADYWDVHGSSVAWIGWEELSNWPTPQLFLRCNSLIRSSHPVAARKKRVRATTNPGGPGHNWIKSRYGLPGMRNRIIEASDGATADQWLSAADKALLGAEAVKPRLRMAIFSDIRENKIFLDADPTYLAGLAADADSDAQRKAWVDGDWDIVSGGMFDDVWNESVHWIQPFDIPRNWRIDRAFDWGETHPFALGWFAQSDGSDIRTKSGKWRATVPGDLFHIGEWYGCKEGQPNVGLKLTSTEIGQGGVERELGLGIYDRCRAGPADTGIFAGFDGKASVADEMNKRIVMPNGKQLRGLSFTPARKGPNSREPGWRHLRSMFKNALRIDSRPRQRPGCFIFDNCTHFRRTFPVLPRCIKRPDDVDTDSEDHIGDMFRYRAIETSLGAIVGGTRGM